jgi:regulator of protease activity HflC (stomatin/prohibitin superfamily)
MSIADRNIARPTVSVFSGLTGILLVALAIAFTIACPFLISREYGSVSYLIGDFFDWLTIPMAVFSLVMMSGFTVIDPKQAAVLVRFGKFKGVLMDNGFFWVAPWVKQSSVSLRIENFESELIKVNDLTGSPIMVGAVVSCQVVDPEAYSFNADDTEDFVMNSIDRVLRSTVSKYAYDIKSTDDHDADKVDQESNQQKGKHICLRDDSEEITSHFRDEVQKILSRIGMQVLDANFTNLSYAPEIAGVMLQRQQASAMMDARKMLVASAVSVVKDALKAMEAEKGGAIKLDSKDKAELASNLLTVLVSERGAQVTLPLQ